MADSNCSISWLNVAPWTCFKANHRLPQDTAARKAADRGSNIHPTLIRLQHDLCIAEVEHQINFLLITLQEDLQPHARRLELGVLCRQGNVEVPRHGTDDGGVFVRQAEPLDRPHGFHDQGVHISFLKRHRRCQTLEQADELDLVQAVADPEEARDGVQAPQCQVLVMHRRRRHQEILADGQIRV